MASPFPPLRISRDGFHRADAPNVSKVRSPEGGRVATSWSSAKTWSFTVKLVGEDELEALKRHWTEAGGGLDTFLFTCPDQGGEYLVEYDMEKLDTQPTESPDVHVCDIALRTVAG
jgi:hypothetical protein